MPLRLMPQRKCERPQLFGNKAHGEAFHYNQLTFSVVCQDLKASAAKGLLQILFKVSSLSIYRGRFGPKQAERLLWRAGFGPRPGEALSLSKLGLAGAVKSILSPGKEQFKGPKPHTEDGKPLTPFDTYGDDHLWWMDRMIRSNHQLNERMTLIWHDWFATSNDQVGDQRIMLAQNQMFRKKGMGNFKDLFEAVTKDPAMIIFLNSADNTKDAPNENYAREMMELFSLGAGRGAYTEQDVRNQARALTGFAFEYKNRPTNFHFDPKLHDGGIKKIFGKSGRFDWHDSVALCLGNKFHPSFFVNKLWSYFIPSQPSAATSAGLQAIYKKSNYSITPVVQAILMHPDFYQGEQMIKPPIVQHAGMLRALKKGIEISDWSYLGARAGQQLFYPPNVSGWDDSRWLDTSTFHGRWVGAQVLLDRDSLNPDDWEALKLPSDPQALVKKALDYWGNPLTTKQTVDSLSGFASTSLGRADEDWKTQAYPVLTLNALRLLYANSPDNQTC